MHIIAKHAVFDYLYVFCFHAFIVHINGHRQRFAERRMRKVRHVYKFRRNLFVHHVRRNGARLNKIRFDSMSYRFVCQHSRKVGVQNAVFYSRVRINALALFHQFFVKRVNLSVILRRRGKYLVKTA